MYFGLVDNFIFALVIGSFRQFYEKKRIVYVRFLMYLMILFCR